MSYKTMWRTMCSKIRYGYKSYLIFLIATLFFLTMFILNLIFADSKELVSSQSYYMIVFLYSSIVVAQAIQTIEFSKCYYLMPTTKEERKKFKIFQNIVKIIISILLATIIFVIGVLVRPEVKGYLFVWYLLGGVSTSIFFGSNGYNTYYGKKKKPSFTIYVVSYVITIVAIMTLLLGGMYYAENHSTIECLPFAVGSVVLSICYHSFYLIRFRKTDISYENINQEERKLLTRSCNGMM